MVLAAIIVYLYNLWQRNRNKINRLKYIRYDMYLNIFSYAKLFVKKLQYFYRYQLRQFVDCILVRIKIIISYEKKYQALVLLTLPIDGQSILSV